MRPVAGRRRRPVEECGPRRRPATHRSRRRRRGRGRGRPRPRGRSPRDRRRPPRPRRPSARARAPPRPGPGGGSWAPRRRRPGVPPSRTPASAARTLDGDGCPPGRSAPGRGSRRFLAMALAAPSHSANVIVPTSTTSNAVRSPNRSAMRARWSSINMKDHDGNRCQYALVSRHAGDSVPSTRRHRCLLQRGQPPRQGNGARRCPPGSCAHLSLPTPGPTAQKRPEPGLSKLHTYNHPRRPSAIGDPPVSRVNNLVGQNT